MISAEPAWEKIGKSHHHGFDLPLSSLKTKQSCGIGEYLDLNLMIDFCKSVGFDTLMLLPLNDTGEDPSPYNALSASALHPIYLSLSSLPNLTPEFDERINRLKKMNGEKRVPYLTILRKKDAFMRRYFEVYGAHFEEEVLQFSNEFPFLKIYALFKILKENMEGQSSEEWPDEIKQLTKTHFQHLLQTHKESIQYILFVQYFCFKQLKKAKSYAEEKNIFLKGDIPILISPDSADVWYHTEYFDLSFAAGAPPDQFTPEGQYWGFPIYRFDVMNEEGFSWWKERLQYASHFYHIYRIDHVIGFFRIWAIPRGQEAAKGRFLPGNEWEALSQGRLVLKEILKASHMLPIAEDLGFMPPGASEILEELSISGTKVFRWEKDPKTGEYDSFQSYSPLSMSTVSTHDSETLRQWWDTQNKEVVNFSKMKGWDPKSPLTKEMRLEILRDIHHTSSFFHINLFNEYLALIDDFVYEDPDDERINIPGEILDRNWTYRMRPYLEEVAKDSNFVKQLKSLFK
ncbi:MAG: 4-alpha-glucanotransferase [Simkaniaceae bacterium]